MERTVVVTGASTGIGAAAARLFAQRGFRVFGTSRRVRPDQDGVEMLVLDVRSDESVRDCVAEVLDRAGGIDVLVNNAGFAHLGVAEETTLEDARGLFETNLFGAARVTNAVLPGMRERRAGRVINVGSAAAWVGEPGEAFYAASKAGLARYTEALRHEVWSHGIHVSLVEPGAFKTDVLDVASVSEGAIADYDVIRQAALRTLRESLGRGGDPGAAAELLVRVATAGSPRFRYAAGWEARWMPYLRALLPQRVFDYALRRAYGLGKPA